MDAAGTNGDVAMAPASPRGNVSNAAIEHEAASALACAPAEVALDLGDDGLGARDLHVAHLRYVDGDDHLRLQLRICNDRKTFYRPVGEKLDKIRYRLQLLATQATAGAGSVPFGGNRARKARNKQQHIAEVASAGSSGDSDGAVTLEKATATAAKIAVRFFTADQAELTSKSVVIGEALNRTTRIVIGGDTYMVLHNQPLVIKISVMNPVIAGIPVVPLPETEFCDPDDCMWQWHRIDADGRESFLCDHRRYIPTESDVGCRFRIECHAPSMHSRFARESAADVVTAPVVPGPDRSVFSARRRLGATKANPGFRVMTYNVLFDGYTSSLQAKAEVFPYVKHEAMLEMYRMQLVFQEIEESGADIISLQEMGQAIFHNFFEPMMAPLGFHTFYTGKTGTTHEGCAVLVRKASFDVIDEKMLDLSVAVRYSTDPGLVQLLAHFPELSKGLRKIPSVAQFITLLDRRYPSRQIVLANTHLFYREDAHMIRLVQTVAVVREIERLRTNLDGDKTGVVLCGDFNSFPSTAPISFLLNGSIDESHVHWQHAASFVWNRANGNQPARLKTNDITQQPESSLSGTRKRMDHSLSLGSACGIPEFTNFAGTFVGTLDYILIGQTQLVVDQVFPLFTREQVSEEVALPSTKFPSDHVSLVADVRWRALADRDH